jgi:hypothetical protein
MNSDGFQPTSDVRSALLNPAWRTCDRCSTVSCCVCFHAILLVFCNERRLDEYFLGAERDGEVRVRWFMVAGNVQHLTKSAHL